MLSFLRGKLSDRKLRLFACACCESVLRFIPNGPCRDVLDVSAKYADGEATADELATSRAIAIGAAERSGPHSAAAWAACAAADPSATRAARAAAEEAREQIRRVSPRAAKDEAHAQAEFLRDIVGNPHQSVQEDFFRWLEKYPILEEIARGLYEETTKDDMIRLAGDLARLGCPNRTVIEHCRSSTPHVRGCWVIDLILKQDLITSTGFPKPLLRAKEIREALAGHLGQKRYRRFLRNLHGSLQGADQVSHHTVWDKFVAQYPQYSFPDTDLQAVFAVCPVHGCDLVQREIACLADDSELLRNPRFLEARGTQFPHAYPEEGKWSTREQLTWWCQECQCSRREWMAARLEPWTDAPDSIAAPSAKPVIEPIFDVSPVKPAIEPLSEPQTKQSSQPLVLLLEDDPDRVCRFTATVQAIDPDVVLRVWADARVMIKEIGPYLASAQVISLDHDLLPADGRDPGDGMEVARYLVRQPVVRPVIIHSSNGERADVMSGEFELAGWPCWRVAPLGDDWIEVDWHRRVRQLILKLPRAIEDIIEVNWQQIVGRLLEKAERTPVLKLPRQDIKTTDPVVLVRRRADQRSLSDDQLAQYLSLTALRVGSGRSSAASEGSGSHVLAWWLVSVESEASPPWIIGAVHEDEAGDDHPIRVKVRGFIADADEVAIAALGTDEVLEALGTLNPFRVEATTRIATSIASDGEDATNRFKYSLRWGSRVTAGQFEFSDPQEAWLNEFERSLFRFANHLEVAASKGYFQERLQGWMKAREGVMEPQS
jgi:hypothetical protein